MSALRAMKVLDVMLQAMAKKITWWQAAEILGISDRHMRRWRERYAEEGYNGLFDRRRGKPSRSFRRSNLGTSFWTAWVTFSREGAQDENDGCGAPSAMAHNSSDSSHTNPYKSVASFFMHLQGLRIFPCAAKVLWFTFGGRFDSRLPPQFVINPGSLAAKCALLVMNTNANPPHY